MLVAVWVVGLLCTACGPEEQAPLYRYNDAWEGEVRFDGQSPLPLRAAIYVTEMDVKVSRDSHNLFQRAYAELSFGDRTLAGWGEATHTDARDVSRDAYTPIPDKEFLELSVLGNVLELAGSAGSGVRLLLYSSTYSAFMAEHDLRPLTDDVRLVGEKRDDAVEGVVVVTTYPSQSGVGVRHLGGTFRLSRVGIAPGRPVDDWQVETDRFLFRSEADTGSLVPRIYIK